MKAIVTTRLRWLLWVLVLAIFVGVWLFPIGTKITRGSGIALFIYVWFGLLALAWKSSAARFSGLGIRGLASR